MLFTVISLELFEMDSYSSQRFGRIMCRSVYSAYHDTSCITAVAVNEKNA